MSTTSDGVLGDGPLGLLAVGGLAYEGDVIGGGQHHGEGRAHQRVVVDHEHADRPAHAGHGSHAQSRY